MTGHFTGQNIDAYTARPPCPFHTTHPYARSVLALRGSRDVPEHRHPLGVVLVILNGHDVKAVGVVLGDVNWEVASLESA